MQENASKRAKRYAKIRYGLAIFETAFTLIFLLFFQFSGLSSKFKYFAGHFSKTEIVVIAVYMVFLGIFYESFIFWLDYFSGYRLEHKFGLSRQGFFSWLKDYFKKMFIGGIIFLVIIEALYFFIRNFQHTWWLWASLFWLIFAIFIAKFFPLLIIPLFYKLEKLKDKELTDAIFELAKKANIKIVDIYKIGLGQKTKKANAALTGIGSSKRILLSDTLLSNYTPEEIEATLAHELAHHKFHHFYKLLFLNLMVTVLSFLVLYGASKSIGKYIIQMPISDVSAFPVFAFIVMSFNIIVTPLQNAASRYFESQADKEAIRLTEKPQAFASLLDKLTEQNLSDPNPSKIIEIFFYDHPPATKRIKAARKSPSAMTF